jgi:hypothetical protein
MVQPEPTASAAEPDPCVTERFNVEDLVVSGRNCHYATGHWHLRMEPQLPGLALWRDDERIDTVLQLFSRPPGEPVDAILPTLRARGYIPPDEECVMAPATLWPAPKTLSFHQIRPVGERLRRLQATPKDEVPDPPCGDYGASTHGVRYFVSDLREPR